MTEAVASVTKKQGRQTKKHSHTPKKPLKTSLHSPSPTDARSLVCMAGHTLRALISTKFWLALPASATARSTSGSAGQDCRMVSRFPTRELRELARSVVD